MFLIPIIFTNENTCVFICMLFFIIVGITFGSLYEKSMRNELESWIL
jgi:hypothetical protein